MSQFFVKDLNGKRGGISATDPKKPLPERLQDVILPAETPFDGVPYVGCAVTIPVGSDSYPGTVCKVSKETVEVEFIKRDKDYNETKVKRTIPKRVWVRSCDFRGVEGHSNAFTENQKYVYLEYPNWEQREGAEYSWRDKKKGYIRVGTSSRSSAAQRIGFGFRRAYRDPSF